MAELSGDQNLVALWCYERWAAAFENALSLMLGAPAKISLSDAPGNAGEVMWWEQEISLLPHPTLIVGAAGTVWRQVGEHALRAAGIDDPEEPDVRSTYYEMLSQSLSSVASAIGGKTGKDISCVKGAAIDSPRGDVLRFASSIEWDGVRAAPFWFGVDTRLIETLAPARNDAAMAIAPAAGAAGLASPARGQSKTIDLLLDVDLPVSVSFGRTQLPLKDVVKLTTGSIVELNRAVSDPVEIIVNNCVIARGEVVVIDGNYGVRIQQIVSRQERLRTLN